MIKNVFLIAASVILLSACGTLPRIKYRAVMNEPAAHGYTPAPHRAIFGTLPAYVERYEQGSPHARRSFVGVSLSGGGTRAALFSAAVLEELDRIGLLSEVYAISSVSGGSITNAYYALNPPTKDPGYWPRFREVVSQDLLKPWLAKSLAPQNFVSVAFTTEDRSDLMADVMDKKIFNGATFADLARSPARGNSPLVLLNATLASAVEPGLFLGSDLGPWYAGGFNAPFTSGERFTFTRDAVARLGSDINDLRVADAVMASGAFPGVFGTRTLAAYRSASDKNAKRLDEPTSTTPLSYVHLIDGGAADNLGADALSIALLRWHQYTSRPSSEERREGMKDPGCMLILVDSSTGSESDNSKHADPRSPLVDYVVDTNALLAIDAMMKRRRVDTLHRMGIDLSRRDRVGIRQRLNREANLSHVFDRNFRTNGAQVVPPTCFVWHISLDKVDEIFEAEPYERWEITPEQSAAVTKFYKDPYRRRLGLAAVGIQTNYKLKSSHCDKSTDISFVLRASARELVVGDSYARSAVCDWMEEQDMSGVTQCKNSPADRMEPLPSCVLSKETR